MAKAEASVEELVSMIERGELRLPEMQRDVPFAELTDRDNPSADLHPPQRLG